MYMRPGRSKAPIFPHKILNRTCTFDLASCGYLFFHPKYEAKLIPATCLVVDTCFLTHNIKPDIYIPTTWLVAGSYYFFQNIKLGIYLRPSQLHLTKT